MAERIGPVFLAGLAFAVVGAALIVGASIDYGDRALLGDALGLLTAAFLAGYLLTVKTLRATLAPGAIMAWSGAVTCAALLVIALISGEELIAETAYGWGILLGPRPIRPRVRPGPHRPRARRPADRVLLGGADRRDLVGGRARLAHLA